MKTLTAYLELTKPRLTALAVLSTGVGYVVSVRGPLEWGRLCVTLLGAALVGGGGNALNQWAERRQDALMERTKRRPLPAGRLRPSRALLFGGAVSLTGVGMLWWLVHPLAGWLGWVTLVTYVAIYTPLKRVTSLCTLVGAVPGAMPPLIGWAAARGALGLEAWVLFAMLFLWQLPHFLAIAWVHRDDYARAGFRMLPVVDPEGTSTARHMVLYGLALLPVSLLPTLVGFAGAPYFVGAVVVGVWFVGTALAAARSRALTPAFRVFVASLGYLPTVLLLMTLSPRAQASLPMYGRVPAFTLTDQRGQAVSEQMLRGQVWIADFIFTRCGGQCPMMSATMAHLEERFRRAQALRLVSFTVDPSWDTPEVLARYAAGYGRPPARWLFLTGDLRTLYRVCTEGFKLSIDAAQGTPQEPITHSIRLALVDGAGAIRGYYDATDAEAMRHLEQDASALLRHL